MNQDMDGSLTGDDNLLGYVEFYDFDVYSKKTNYSKELVGDERHPGSSRNLPMWQVSRSSQDMYETDTGYYHKTLNFAIYKQEE